MKKSIKTFDELKKILKDKLPEFLLRSGIQQKKGNSKMFHSFYPGKDDKNPSLHIFQSSGDETLYHCFSSNRTGDIFMANHIINGAPMMGAEFMTENVKPLVEMFDIDYEFRPLSDEEVEEMNIRSIYTMTRDIVVADFKKLLRENALDEKVLAYCNERSITPEYADYAIGYCRNYEDLVSELVQRGATRKFIEAHGIKEFIFNPNNLIFSIIDEKNVVRGFAARNCHFDKENRVGAKYYNCEANSVYTKGTLLYNINKALRKQSGKFSSLYIAEGYTDAIALDRSGLKAVAIGSTKFTNGHIALLQRIGMTDIVLILDGDKPGIENTGNAITKVMEGIRNFRVRIVTLPNDEDPDSFLRKYHRDDLMALPHITPFEWRLRQMKENSDKNGYEIAAEMIPLIVNESSAIQRDKMAKEVADMCDLPLNVIRKDVQALSDQKSIQQSAEKEAVIDNMIKMVKKNPEDGMMIIKNSLDSLINISDRHGSNIYDIDEFVNELNILKQHQESSGDEDYLNIFRMPRFEAKMKGSTSGKLFLLGGQPNAGKTVALVNWAIGVLRSHEGDQLYGQTDDPDRFNNVCIFYHTIDDSRKELLPRFVSALAFDLCEETSINAAGAPNVEDNLTGIRNTERFHQAREYAFSMVNKWAQEGRLVIKDSTIGATLSSGEMVIRSIQKKYPDRHIIYIIDNLHNLQDFANIDDDVKRIKEISNALKQNILVPRNIMGFCTVEYKKGQEGKKTARQALNELMKESKSLEYHANWIGHLMNEMHTNPDDTEMFVYDPAVPVEHRTADDRCPIIRLVIGKNKISSYKGELHYMLFPRQGVFREIRRNDVLQMSGSAFDSLRNYYFGKNEDIEALRRALQNGELDWGENETKSGPIRA